MTTSATSDTELLTEHFGYPPVSLIDDIINSVNILAERALNSVEQGLLNAPPSSLGFKPSKSKSSKSRQKKADNNDDDDDDGSNDAEKAKTEVEAGTHQLETLLCASIDRNFDKFEIYILRNVLCVKPVDVRDWMRLSHYEGLDFSAVSSSIAGGKGATNGDRMDVDVDAPTLDSINLLRRKLRESMRLNALLAAERARNEKMLSELRDLLGTGAPARVKTESASPSAATNLNGNPEVAADNDSSNKQSPFAFLHRKGDLTDGGAATPLSTTTAFTLSQMQALRALSTSLRNVTPDLQPADDNNDSNSLSPTTTTTTPEGDSAAETKKKKSWRRERLEYVEGATRRHLETVQGLELGRHGEVRDGEWQGAGRGLARGEVEGLERVVGLLGGSAGGDDNGDDAATATATATATVPTTTPAKAGRTPRAASASRSKSARKKKTSGGAAGGGAGEGEGGDGDGDGDGEKMDES